ncbi:MAG TPA: L-aspartate oxidase [Mycobacteriales bacterium]|nr:L-aspartate oxidase [Mycobacteriales bacterium]
MSTTAPAATATGVFLPRRLAAPEPGWTRRTDVVVVGSGIAGLTVALRARASGRVLLVTKALLAAGSTSWAQGGIAAALDPLDSAQEHLVDTLVAGAGLCDEAAVRVLVTEGPARVRELAALGAAFDRDPITGALALTREGGHLRDRIVHAGGDATGAEVERALIAAVRADSGIEVVEHAAVLDLLLGADGQAAGLTLHVLGEGSQDGVGAVHARAVVLATGGMGQVYASTTNPPVATGDGVAIALRAGAAVRDLEFVQFHPTVMYLGADAPLGAQPLLSEAMRGEGARIVDAAGESVLAGVHPLGDLAPRDVVAKAMGRRMLASGVDHLYLDARHLGASLLLQRFPTIVLRSRSLGFDPVTDLVPVAPAAHYASGGVAVDLDGRSSVPGLFACGEVACTGVHGANRLASNSLLEGLVFATRIGDALAAGLPAQARPCHDGRLAGLIDRSGRTALVRSMTGGAGVLRSGASLAGTALTLAGLPRGGRPAKDAWEMTNLHTVASALVAAAAARSETRGSHWREEYDTTRERWRCHLDATLAEDGQLHHEIRR